MKTTIYKYRLLGIALTLCSLAYFTTSCTDILDTKPLGSISEKDVFNDPTFLRQYVNNTYNGMRRPFVTGVIPGQWQKGTGGFIGLTDLATIQPSQHGNANGISNYLEGLMNPDNVTTLTFMWDREYEFIKRANTFFEKIQNSDIQQSTLDQMKGEMHFLRAWMYFDLSRLFGGVPIIKDSFSLADESFDVKRNSYDEVGKFVIEECEKAIALLDGTTVQPGQISKEAAMALKARMLLYMASPLHNPSNDMEKWKAAETATEAVLNAGFALHPSYKDLFLQPIKKDETILARRYTVGNGINPWGLNYNYWPSGFDARQELNATQAFVNMFQMTNGEYPYQEDGVTVNQASGYDPQQPNLNRDPRYYDSILYPGAGPVHIIDGSRSTHRLYEYWEDANPNPNNEPPYQNPNKVDPENGEKLFDFGRDSRTYWAKGYTGLHYRVNTGYTFRKLADFSSPRADPNADYKHLTVFMRLAEFYLNYAEIQIALGNEQIAREYINKVRNRQSVQMPPVTASGEELEKIYRRERAVELHLEDMRFFDLMRWKAAPGNVDLEPIRGLTEVTMDWTGAEEGDLKGTLNYTYGPITSVETRASWPGDYYYLFPIPQEEIKRSNGQLTQNPGY